MGGWTWGLLDEFQVRTISRAGVVSRHSVPLEDVGVLKSECSSPQVQGGDITTVTHCEVRGSFGNLGAVAMLGLLTSAFSPAFPALLSSHELLQAASSRMSMSSCTEMAPGLQSSDDAANISNISKLGGHPGADVNFGCFKLAVSGLPLIPC